MTLYSLVVTGDVFLVVVAFGALPPGEQHMEATSWTGG